ncbi:hypothetical protein H310_07838 [Aphanomyces invadans]|uniref:Uncharacterized protein n=1 Tax=Aphanomyces invadans TaxID=157072 RepID=A0A024U2E8_9STRA|nr:hypothetical protein H310_07838 [Aphanomyces invadans]ETV99792.1 hypothetical protein H310_07838 [Aphanomyces invadans]|eukprot:XP_008871568.1 hypothetical protein H310_07838 [Aphanomyces invadans]
MTALANFLPNNAIPVHTGAPPAEDPSSSTQVNNAGMEVDSDSDSGYDGNSAAESSSDDDDDATKTSEPRNTTNEADDDDDDEDDTKMEYDEADDECDRTAPSQEPWPTPREAAKVSKKAAKAARQQANKPEQATTATPTPTTEPRSYASAVGGNKRTSRKRDVGFHPLSEVDLATLLEKSISGTWTYSAVVDLDPTPRLETVGHLLMHINVDKIRDQPPPNWKFVLQEQPAIET